MGLFKNFYKNVGSHYDKLIWNILDPAGFFDFGKKSNWNDVGQNLDSFLAKQTGSELTGAEQQANEFSAQQAELQYQRQREFYQDFQSPEAQVRQFQEAGLNPALMYGRGVSTASPIGGSAPSSVSPSQSGDFGQLLSTLAGISFQKKELNFKSKVADSEIERNKALAELYRNQATGQGNENQTYWERYQYWKQKMGSDILNTNADTFVKYADEELKRQGIRESEARETLLKFQSVTASAEAKWAEQAQRDLHNLRNSADDLNRATAENARQNTAESAQRLTEAKQSWGTRWRSLQETLRKLSADAGMSEQEASAYWTDKRINELLVMSEIYSNYKTTQKIGPFSGERSDWIQNQINSGTPSMYAPLFER